MADLKYEYVGAWVERNIISFAEDGGGAIKHPSQSMPSKSGTLVNGYYTDSNGKKLPFSYKNDVLVTIFPGGMYSGTVLHKENRIEDGFYLQQSGEIDGEFSLDVDLSLPTRGM